jgi:hypothetical protein
MPLPSRQHGTAVPFTASAIPSRDSATASVAALEIVISGMLIHEVVLLFSIFVKLTENRWRAVHNPERYDFMGKIRRAGLVDAA